MGVTILIMQTTFYISIYSDGNHDFQSSIIIS